MLTLITGANGAGKTAFVVAELERMLRDSPRPLVVMGIPELVLPHEVAPALDQWTRRVPLPEDPSIEEAEYTFPEGALVVIDEAQKIFRQRAVGSKVPDYVSAIEKHRHRGLDLWFVTQHPQLLDTSVRRLVAKHLHVRAHWAGRELLEWSELADPESAGDRARAVRRPYVLPKHAFSLYRSASQHVKAKRRIPVALYVFGAAVLVAAFLAWRLYGKFAGEGGEPAKSAETQGAAKKAWPGGAAGAAGGAMVKPELSVGAFEPRLRGRPESAPLYDALRQVVAMPVVVGCVATRTRCQCVTEQGSDAGYSVDECRAWLKSPPFSPFRVVLPPMQVERGVKGTDARPAPVHPEKPLLRLPDKA